MYITKGSTNFYTKCLTKDLFHSKISVKDVKIDILPIKNSEKLFSFLKKIPEFK